MAEHAHPYDRSVVHRRRQGLEQRHDGEVVEVAVPGDGAGAVEGISLTAGDSGADDCAALIRRVEVVVAQDVGGDARGDGNETLRCRRIAGLDAAVGVPLSPGRLTARRGQRRRGECCHCACWS